MDSEAREPFLARQNMESYKDDYFQNLAAKNSENLEIRRENLHKFEMFCDQFFHTNDSLYGVIISMVEFSKKRLGSQLQELAVSYEQLDAHLTSIASPKHFSSNETRGKVEEYLNSIGIIEGIWIYPHDWPIFIEAKRKRREVWHLQAAYRLECDLESLIKTLTLPERGYITTLGMLGDLNRFLTRFRNCVGVTPFVKGLEVMLAKQLANQNYLSSWQLEDVTFTQSGPDFLTSSVTLLIKTLGFKPFVLPNTTAQTEGSMKLRDWIMHPYTTNFQLLALLKLITTNHSYYRTGRPAGECSINNGLSRYTPLSYGTNSHTTQPARTWLPFNPFSFVSNLVYSQIVSFLVAWVRLSQYFARLGRNN